MAHEFCHVAVIMLFNNGAKPYEKSDNESAEKFKILHKKFQDQINQGIIVDEDGIIKLVYDNYKQEKWDAELIVRVPHILAHYEENGEKILNDNAGDLLIFYNELIIPKLNYFIENSYLIRPKKHIEYINLKLNYLFKIEESSFRLKKPIRLGEDFFCSKIKPNILLIGSINTFNSCISLYQFLTKESKNFVIADFRNYSKYKNDELMNSRDFDTLVVDLNESLKIEFKNNFKTISNEISSLYEDDLTDIDLEKDLIRWKERWIRWKERWINVPNENRPKTAIENLLRSI
jgi:hypothetical protein